MALLKKSCRGWRRPSAEGLGDLAFSSGGVRDGAAAPRATTRHPEACATEGVREYGEKHDVLDNISMVVQHPLTSDALAPGVVV